MWVCPTCGEQLDDTFDACWKCANQGVEIEVDEADDHPRVVSLPSDIQLSTTATLPGYALLDTRGFIASEAVLALGPISDVEAGLAALLGGRSATLEQAFANARQTVLATIADQARQLGANAIIGLHLSYERIHATTLLVAASGTAVLVAPRPINEPKQ